MPLALAAATIVPPAGLVFACTPVRVWDGDGPIYCAERRRIRLAEIAAREFDGSCPRGHPCPEASGIAARDALLRLLGKTVGTSHEGHVLVGGPTRACRSRGPCTYRWMLAECAGAAGDLGTAIVGAGLAARWSSKEINRRG
jgi:endonuclease YncB( thermonuclease family)